MYLVFRRLKEPLSVSTVQAIATHFASSASLSDLRFLFILLVGFAGFFRIDEIRKTALRMSLYIVIICLFMYLSAKTTSIGKATLLFLLEPARLLVL